MAKPSVISLFTGAGGLDYGFEAAGFRTAVAAEIDLRCCQTLRQNRKWPILQRDVTELAGAELLAAAGLGAGEADVLIGGPPCQPFSKAGFWVSGQAQRLRDPRAGTLDAYLRLLGDVRPKAFLLENVEGLGFKGKDEGLRLIKARLSDLNRRHGLSYRADVAVLNAADYGVPQQRKRLFIVGARDGAPFSFPAPTHGPPEGFGRPAWLTCWDAFHDLARQDVSGATPSGKWAALLPTIPEGMNYLWHTDRGGGEPLFGWRRRYWSFLLKLAADQPSWTLQAQPGPATGPFHWENRRLTTREMARLQTFPDSVTIEGGLRDAQLLLGNAVPSLLAEVLAREISMQVLGRAPETDAPRLSVRRASRPAPRRRPASPLPQAYVALRGEHTPHPGTGGGARAQTRRLIAAE